MNMDFDYGVKDKPRHFSHIGKYVNDMSFSSPQEIANAFKQVFNLYNKDYVDLAVEFESDYGGTHIKITGTPKVVDGKK